MDNLSLKTSVLMYFFVYILKFFNLATLKIVFIIILVILHALLVHFIGYQKVDCTQYQIINLSFLKYIYIYINVYNYIRIHSYCTSLNYIIRYLLLNHVCGLKTKVCLIKFIPTVLNLSFFLFFY